MARNFRAKVPLELERARGKFEECRKNKKQWDRIPEPLWELAVSLAKKFGINFTKTVLKLDYDSLKKRCERAKAKEEHKEVEFLELPKVARAAKECVIQWRQGNSRVKVELKGYEVQEIVAVGRGMRGTK